MPRFASITFAVTAFVLIQSNAQAQRVDNTALFKAAQKYRASVVNFEKVVVSTFGIVRSDEKVVDKFEESTLRVVNAAKNPRLTTRLRNEYKKTLPLQEKAAQSIFGRYTPTRELLEAWDYVLFCQGLFEQEYSLHITNPRNRTRVQRLPATTTNPFRFTP